MQASSIRHRKSRPVEIIAPLDKAEQNTGRTGGLKLTAFKIKTLRAIKLP